MTTTRSWLLALVTMASLVSAGVAACRGPTEITVHIRTDVPCSDSARWHGVAVYSGAPGIDVETREPILTSTNCGAAGDIGSVVLVPTGAKDTPIGVRVVAGITRPPEECATHAYDGCIVARRTLNFVPHEALDLEIALTGDCIGHGCDAQRTCVAGLCIDARLNPPAAALDASAPPTDGGTLDAAADAPTVRCGDNGVQCPLTGNVCCLTVVDGGTQGVCKDSALCPPTSIVLRCDDEADCPGPADDAGRTPVCCVDYDSASVTPYCPALVRSAQCFPYAACVVRRGFELSLCETRAGCQHGAIPCRGLQAACAADPMAMPGYFGCQIPE